MSATRSSSTGRRPDSTLTKDRVETQQRRKSTTERSASTSTSRAIPSTSASAVGTRPMSMVRSPPTTSSSSLGPSRSRPASQPNQKQTAKTSRSSTSRSPTPTSSANSSRRSSVVLDTSAYRYSLIVGSISRFPPAASGSGANTILAANAAERERKATSRTSTRDELGVDPSRASIGSEGSSRSSSRMSSRYMAEEVAPQRRPVYLALPSDPAALGPWSSTGSTRVPNQKGENKDKDKESGEGARRNSKIMTTFPFPHPVTPRRRGDRNHSDGSASSGNASGLGAAWQRLLTAIFAGPYERQLIREEQEDDRITQSIIAEIAQRNSSHPHSSTTTDNATNTTSYGTLPIPNKPSSPASSEEDPTDPYGYRRLAGPHLLPSYTTDLLARRRERRRARSRARFQCMASWTIWTVSVLLVVIVLVLAFSMVFPDRLDIPSHHDDGEDEDEVQGLRVKVVGAVMQRVMALIVPSTGAAS